MPLTKLAEFSALDNPDLHVGDVIDLRGPCVSPELQGKYWRVRTIDVETASILLDGPFTDVECLIRYHLTRAGHTVH